MCRGIRHWHAYSCTAHAIRLRPAQPVLTARRGSWNRVHLCRTSPRVASGLKKDTATFSAVCGRRCQCADTRRQSPLLYVGLDKDKAALSEVDV